MMQQGIGTPDMDVRWVSSLSWYFLNLFGLNGLFRLLLGSDNGMSSIIVFIIFLLMALSLASGRLITSND